LIYWKSHYKNKDIELQLFKKYKPQIIKRCNIPNSLTDKEKAIISDGLSSVAPPSGLEPETLSARFS
jgi:hypothetical protein